MPHEVRIGTAGWSVPKQHAVHFPAGGSHLERYASRFDAVEINSSFHRPHMPRTYERWAAGVPEGFRFAVKVPREITHARRLAGAAEPLARFLTEAGALGARLGPLLVQLPPSLRFDAGVAVRFFEALRGRFGGDVACEPRHPSWFADGADEVLSRFRVARVAADPARAPRAAEPGGWGRLAYFRLHGSPRMYYSGYATGYLDALARRLAEGAAVAETTWCAFDNTALGEATGDALGLLRRLRPPGGRAGAAAGGEA